MNTTNSDNLAAMLEQYRAGERGMPTHAELSALCCAPAAGVQVAPDGWLRLAKESAHHLEGWLAQDDCDCENGHTCGKPLVQATLHGLRELIAAPAALSESAPSEDPSRTLYTTNQPTLEALTFDEFVQFGRDNGGNIVGGMPWSFKYKGLAITHENDDCYLIPAPDGTYFRFTREHMLVTFADGSTVPEDATSFMRDYMPLVAGPSQRAPYEAPGEVQRLSQRLDKMGITHFSFTRGSNPNATPDQIAAAISSALDQLASAGGASGSPPEPAVRDGANSSAWVSVADDLPEVETDVLVYGKRGNSIGYSVAGIFNDQTYCMPSMLKNSDWMAQDSEQELRFKVSHWMPLPAVPVAGQSGKDGEAE